jgi:hypothetical protein
MSAFVRHLRTAQNTVLALICITATLGVASAEPANNSGLSNAECYGKDSGCTQFCGKVTGDMRYECFSICDRMLDHCLDTGDWSDSIRIDPTTGNATTKANQLSAFMLRMMMSLGDTDGDGMLSPKEIDAFKQRISKGVDTNDGPKTPAAPDKR